MISCFYHKMHDIPIIRWTITSPIPLDTCMATNSMLLHVSADTARGSERQDFLSEIDMMKKVSEGHSPHVVGMLGCVTLQEPLCLVTEFVKYGDLLSYLRSSRKIVSASLICYDVLDSS